MHIIEQLCENRDGNPNKNEDSLVVTPHFAAVFDGATARGSPLYEGRTTARMAAEILVKAVETLPPTADCAAALVHLTQAIADDYIKRGMVELVQKEPWQRFTASGAIYSAHYRQIWLVGDCQALVGTTHHTQEKLVDFVIYRFAGITRDALLREGKYTMAQLRDADQNPIWNTFLPITTVQQFYQNAEFDSVFSHPVFDGTPIHLPQIDIIDVPADVHEIILASDGYPALANTLEESEKLLAQILADDPLCYKKNFQLKVLKEGAKANDDRTYLRLGIN
jgi:hypothetical protein